MLGMYFHVALLLAFVHIGTGENIFIKLNDKKRLYSAITKAKAGQSIFLKDGIWSDVKINLHGVGNSADPIILSAENPGKVVLSGSSQIRIGGNFIIIRGFRFENGHAVSSGKSTSVIEFRTAKGPCRYCTMEDVLIKGYENKEKDDHWVRVFGYKNKVLNCQFQDKGIDHFNTGKMIWVHAEFQANYHTIKNNNFINYKFYPQGRNGREALQIGSSRSNGTKTETRIENNFFESCNGDREIVTIKASHTKFIRNVFQNCHGNFSLRHGTGSIIQGNKFLSDYSARSGGIQVRGSDHKINYNWLQNIKDAAIVVHGTMEKPSGVHRWLRWFPAKNIDVKKNTLVNNLHGMAFGTWPYKNYRYYGPQQCFFSRNKIVSNRIDASIFQERNKYYAFKFEGNQVDGSSLGIKSGKPDGVIVKKLLAIEPISLIKPTSRGPSFLN